MTTSGEGFTAEVEGDKLIITVDLTRKGTPSKSGKNMTVATTRGNRAIGDVTVGLNVYRQR
jgi:D-alanyl-D-alanine carboxypeptidase